MLKAYVKGRRQYRARIHVEAGEHLGVGFGHQPRGINQAVAVGVLSDGYQDLADRCFDSRSVNSVWLKRIGAKLVRLSTIYVFVDLLGHDSCWSWGHAGLSTRTLGRRRPANQPATSSQTVTGARSRDGRQLRFLHNRSWTPFEFVLPVGVQDVLGDKKYETGDVLMLGAWDVRILVES